MLIKPYFFKHISQDLNSTWTYEETCYLWNLCEKFDLKFIVISDRYEEKYHRSIEDLKSRYYSITKKVLEVLNYLLNYMKKFNCFEMKNETNNPLYHYTYDADYEKIRKYHLEKFIMRPKEKNEEEKNLLEELKRIEQVKFEKWDL